MSQVGELNVRIGADTAGLNKGLNEARGAVGGFNQSLGTTLSNLKTMHVAIAGTVAAVASFVKSSMDAVNAQTDLAKSLNTSYASLVTFNRAAQLTGVNDATAGIRFFNRALSEASTGSGAAADVLKRLNINVNELAALPIDERVKLFGQRLSELVPITEQVSVASTFFGREAAKYLELLRDTSVLEQAKKQMEALGLALSNIDAEVIGAADDEMSIFGLTVKAVGQQIALSVSPAIAELSKRFRELFIESGLFKNILFVLDAGIRLVIATVRDFWNILNYLPDALGAVVGNMLKLIALIPGFGGLAKTGDMLVQNFNETWKALQGGGAIGRTIMGLDDLKAKWDAIGKAAAEAGFQTGGGGSTGLTDEQRKELQKRLDAVKESLLTESQLLDKKYQTDQASLKEALTNKLISEQEYNQALQALQIKHQEKLWEIEANSPEAMRLQKLAENVIALENSLLTEEEMLIADYEKKHQMLADFYTVQGQITAEGKALLEKLEIDHQDKLYKVREKGMTDMMRFAEQARRGDYKDALGTLQKMTAATAGANKDMFNMNKAATLAEAVLDAYKAITGAYRWGVSKGGPPLGAAMAAAAGAFQFAQIRAISSQQYNGAGTTAPSVAAATPAGATAVADVGGGGGGGDGGQTVTINLTGEIFGREQVRNLITQINEAISDGSTLRLT